MEKWRCPTCNAPYKGENECHRCRCNLSILVTILEQAAELRCRAIHLLKEGKLKEAHEAVQYSLFLHHNNQAEELEALICASQGKFDKALRYL